MKKPRTFLWHSFASVIDQVILSGINFTLGLALIRFSSKEAYGLYSQLFAASLLSTTLLSSIVGAAIHKLAHQLGPDERRELLITTLPIQWGLALCFATIGGCVVYFFSTKGTSSENGFLLSLAFVFFIFSLGCREYCRSALFVESKSVVVVKLDLIFVSLTFAGLGLLYSLNLIFVSNLMILLAFSNGIAVAFYGRSYIKKNNFQNSLKHVIEKNKLQFLRLWSVSKWALNGAVLGWVLNNSYLYIAGFYLGSEKLADLNAARLPLMPISMMGAAWSNVALVAIGKIISKTNWIDLNRLIIKSIFSLLFFSAIYVGVVVGFFPWISKNIIGIKYANILDLIIIWSIYFSVVSARLVGTIVLFGFGAYKLLFTLDTLVACIFLISYFFVVPSINLSGSQCIVFSMIVSELFSFFALFLYLIPKVKREVGLKVN